MAKTELKLVSDNEMIPVRGNWLAELEPGSVFVCRSRNMSRSLHSLEQYHVLWHSGICTGLFHNMNDIVTQEPVDNARFSNNMELVAVLGNSLKKEEQNDRKDHPSTSGAVQDGSSN